MNISAFSLSFSLSLYLFIEICTFSSYSIFYIVFSLEMFTFSLLPLLTLYFSVESLRSLHFSFDIRIFFEIYWPCTPAFSSLFSLCCFIEISSFRVFPVGKLCPAFHAALRPTFAVSNSTTHYCAQHSTQHCDKLRVDSALQRASRTNNFHDRARSHLL